MVTIGKSSLSMGWVVIEVVIGFSCQSLYDLPIRIPAAVNPRQTMINQRIFADLVLGENNEKRKQICRNLP